MLSGMTISAGYLTLLSTSCNVRVYTHHDSESSTVSITLPGRNREDISLTAQDYGLLLTAPEKRLGGPRLAPLELPLYVSQRAAESVSATMRDGILTLVFPKPAPRTIAVG